MLQIYTKILTWYKKLFKIYFNDFLKAPEWHTFYKAKLLPCGRDFYEKRCSHSVATSMKNVAPIRSQLPFLSYNGTPLRPRKDE